MTDRGSYRKPLTVREVARVREAHEAGHPLPVIAASFGISERQAQAAVAGKTKGWSVPAEPRRPACMDDDEWDGWQVSNRVQAYGNQSESPCDDCIPAFALEMRAEGRCDGIPAGVEDEDPPLPAPRPFVRRHKRNRPSEARSEAMRRAWAEGKRSREQLAEQNRRPDVLEIRAEVMRERWTVPAFRAQHVRMMRERWQDPEYRAEMAQVINSGRPRIHERGCPRGRRCGCGARSVA